MERANVAIFLMAIGLIGIAPILLAAVAIARRRTERRPDADARSARPLVVLGVVTAVLLVGGGALAWRFSSPGAAATEEPMAGMPGMDGSSGMDGMTGMEADVAGMAHGGLPGALAGQPLTSFVDGPEAIASVTQLHGSSFVPTSAEIAGYGDGVVTIWHSDAPDEAAALRQVERMAGRIADGRSPFEAPRVQPSTGVYATFGMGQQHFFFARGSSVWWIATDPAIASGVLEETLAVAT